MAFKMKGSPHKMGTIQGTNSALKQKKEKTPVYQAKSDTTYTTGSTSVVEATKADGTKYPVVRYLGDKEYSKVLKSLPGAVFKGGKNTNDVADVDRDKYSRFLASFSKKDK